MSASLFISSYPGTFHLIVVQDGVVQDFALWWPERPDPLGAAYCGIIRHIKPALGAAFVDIAAAEDGLMPLPKEDVSLCEGGYVHVKLVRSPQNGKGPRLHLINKADTSRSIGMIKEPPSAFARICASWDIETIYVDTPRARAMIPKEMHAKCARGFREIDIDLKEICEQLVQPRLWLNEEMSVSFTATPALVAIDMDLRPVSGQTHHKQRTQFEANKRAFPLLARQIRLRNLTGALVVDPAGLSMKNRYKLLPFMRRALDDDPLSPRCLDVTRLGLIEIVRKKTLPSLFAQYDSPYGRALRLMRMMISEGREAEILKASRALIEECEGMTRAREEAFMIRGRPFKLVSMPQTEDMQWEACNAQGEIIARGGF